jgi:hypothetical protein
MRLGLTRTRTFWGYGGLDGTTSDPALNVDQKTVLLFPPAAAVPWDEALDIVTGRVLREGLEDTVVFSEEIAEAYDLDAKGGIEHSHSWHYMLEHIDDEFFLPAGNWNDPVNDLRGHIDAVSALREPDASDGWITRCNHAAQVMQGMRAADMLRIGKVLTGLPQMGLVTMTMNDTTARLEQVQQRLFVPVGRDDNDPAMPDFVPEWFTVNTAVSFEPLP